MKIWLFCLISLALITGSASAASYTLNLPSGLGLIANHLNHAGGNTLNNMLPSPPDATVFYKWSCRGWTVYQFDELDLVWYPNGLATLNPGEGAFILNPDADVTVTFTGTRVTPALPPLLACRSCCFWSGNFSLA